MQIRRGQDADSNRAVALVAFFIQRQFSAVKNLNQYKSQLEGRLVEIPGQSCVYSTARRSNRVAGLPLQQASDRGSRGRKSQGSVHEKR